MNRPEQQIHRAVVQHLDARGVPGLVWSGVGAAIVTGKTLLYPDRQQQIEYSRPYRNGDEAGKHAAYNGGPNYGAVSFRAIRRMSSDAHQSVGFRHGLTLQSMELSKGNHDSRRRSVNQLTQLKKSGKVA